MENLIGIIDKIKKVMDDTFKIPLTYLIFFILNLFIYIRIDNKLFNFILENKYLKELLFVLIRILDLLYSKYLVVSFILAIFSLFIVLISEKTNVFNKIFPEESQFLDGNRISWNEYSAVNRIFGILTYLTTYTFVYYMLFKFIKNSDDFVVNNSFITVINSEEIELNILWVINQFFLAYLAIKSLFVIRYQRDIRFFTSTYYEYNFINIESFSYVKKNFSGNKERYLLCKNKNNKEFYLLRVLEEKKIFNNGLESFERISESSKKYYVEDVSSNLEDVLYVYNKFKERLSNE